MVTTAESFSSCIFSQSRYFPILTTRWRRICLNCGNSHAHSKNYLYATLYDPIESFPIYPLSSFQQRLKRYTLDTTTMDAYQKHLERQLQQQQHHIRLQGNDPNTPRHLPSQPPQQQGSIQPPPQWTPNMLPGTQPQTHPISAPGFPRGMPNNPMGIGAQQQATQQVAQGQQNAFASSPQALVQNLQSPAQASSQKSHSSPPPGSPVIGDPRIPFSIE